jgi:hypothetical protein
MSPDYMNVNHEVRTDSRRRLLQLGNVLSLPEAIKSWHENAEHWLDQAYAMADALRHRMCPEIDVPNGLNNLTKRIFDAHQAVMNNGTVRCDADLSNNRFEITGCQFDKTPTEYNHELRCDNNAHVQFPGESAIWMIPNTENLYKTFLMVSRHAQPTSAPTPQPTQAPTLPVTTDVPTTLEPTTAAPTTHAPTDVPTTAAPTSAPTTVAPARNTTTRLYWIRQRSEQVNLPSTIWGADIDPVTGLAGEPWVFLTEPDITLPCAMYYDAENGFFYWIEEVGGVGSNLYVARVNQTENKHSKLYNATLLDNQGTYCGRIFIDNQQLILYWQNSLVDFITSPINPKEPWETLYKRRVEGLGNILAYYSTISFRLQWIVFGIPGVNGLNTGKVTIIRENNSKSINSKVTNITRSISAPFSPENCNGVLYDDHSKKLFLTYLFNGLSAIYSADIINFEKLTLSNISLVYNTTNKTILAATGYSTISFEN